MSLFRRIKMVAEAKANKAVNKAEDPRETIELSYSKLREQGQKTRSAIADVAASKARIGAQIEELEAKRDKLASQAIQAAQQGNDELATKALTLRGGVQQQIDEIAPQFQNIAARQEALEETSKRIQAKIQSLATQKETLKASYTAAEASVKVNESIAGIGEEMSDIGLAMQRAKDKTAELDARSQGLNELLASGVLDDPASPPVDEIQLELDRVNAGGVAGELAAIKAQLAAGSVPEPKALGAASSTTPTGGQQ